MGSWIIPVAILAIIAIAYTRYLHRPSWEYLRNREPDKTRWVGLYSSNQLPIVEEALAVIKDSFLLRDDDVYRLQPKDLLHDIYNSAYPHKLPDALEFESLAKTLLKKGVPRDTLAKLTNASVEDVINLCLAHDSSGATDSTS